jgi:hypothetical protein
MPRNLLMQDLVLRAQRRIDREGDSAIGPAEWKALISEQFGHLYTDVVKAGWSYYDTTSTITANGAASYALPSDNDVIIGVDRVLSTGQIYQLDELMTQERNAFAGLTGDAAAYRIVGQTLVLLPRPTSGTYTLWYVPQSPDISSLADTSSVDVVTADGEAFLIYGVAAKAAAKLREDPSLHLAERDAAEQRFIEDVSQRALMNPRRRVVMRSPILDGGLGDWGDGLWNDPGSWRFR